MTLHDFLTHNFWLKCFSLLLAALVWFTIRFEMGLGPNTVSSLGIRTFNQLRVNVLSDAASTRTFAVKPSSVAVTVTAEASLLPHLSSRDLLAFVKFTGTERAHATARKVEVLYPPGVFEVKVEPPLVQVDEIPQSVPSPPKTP